jgi:probable phosphoglycerate mutase
MSVIVRLVRHAESEGNREKKLVGWLDLPLSERGLRQAEALRDALGNLRPDSLWSSDLTRAVHTARIAFGEPVQDAAIREMDFGELDGLTFDRIPPEYLTPLLKFGEFQSPGGESMAVFQQRIFGFFDSLPAGEHVVVAHGGVLRVVGELLGISRYAGNTGWLRFRWHERELLESWDPEQHS